MRDAGRAGVGVLLSEACNAVRHTREGNAVGPVGGLEGGGNARGHAVLVRGRAMDGRLVPGDLEANPVEECHEPVHDGDGELLVYAESKVAYKVPSLSIAPSVSQHKKKTKQNGSGRHRSVDFAVNSHMLYRLSYRTFLTSFFYIYFDRAMQNSQLDTFARSASSRAAKKSQYIYISITL